MYTCRLFLFLFCYFNFPYTCICARCSHYLTFISTVNNWWPAGFRGTPEIIRITGKFACSVSSLCQHFPIVLTDFAIVYYVTIAPYNSKSSSRYHVCSRAPVLAYFRRVPGLFIRFIRANRSSKVEPELSSDLTLLIFLV